MFSFRYVPAIVILAAIALVPTLIHSYGGAEAHDDGRSAAAMSTSLAGYSGVATGRNATWGRRKFGSEDWIERTYSAPGDELRLVVVRSTDAKSLYHHPELAIADETAFDRPRTIFPSERPSMPVHVLDPTPGGGARAVYVLEYAGRFVENPVRFQIRTSLEQLVSRRKPMTLFFVIDRQEAAADADDSSAMRLLIAAVDSFTQAGS
jgi:hypothetical protein